MIKKTEIHNKTIGFIMDGNRRWAKIHGTSLEEAYNKGSQIFFMSIIECIKYKIETIIFYALSFDNFNKRNHDELKIIYNIGIIELNNKKCFFIQNKIKIIFIGNKNKYNQDLLNLTTNLEVETNTKDYKITIFILMIYDPIEDVLNYDPTNKKLLYSYLIPNVDIIIRTGGLNRLSGFLPIQSMYSNIITINELWPDLNENILFKTLNNNNTKNQNYGK